MSQKQDKVQTVQDVTLRLIEARSLLAAGWIQNKAHRNGSYCIVGAIFSELASLDSQNGHDWRVIDCVGAETERGLNELIPPDPNNEYYSIATWNDETDRTQEEVLALMDTAIGNSMNRG